MVMDLQCHILSFAALYIFIWFGSTNGEFERKFSRTLEDQLPTINVDGSNYSSIQAAIDAVPSNNMNWISISVKAGVYNEQVIIPRDKPFIYLKGEGIGKTIVVWNSTGLATPTFDSMADNILVAGITFMNAYNYPPNVSVSRTAQSLAAKISGDKSAFYNCSFLGFQDTLLDRVGRHYFVNCFIEGAIDFIFGNGRSIYQNCTISQNIGARYPNLAGFIAAQGRDKADEKSGFVFKECSVIGNGSKTLLGRAYGAFSTVIFYNSFLSDDVVSVGWSAWTNVGHEANLTFAEAECKGPGSNKSDRVKWEKTLTPTELQSFINISYIDNEGWINKLPQH